MSEYPPSGVRAPWLCHSKPGSALALANTSGSREKK